MAFIKYVKDGIGYCIEDYGVKTIYLNKNLLKYKELHNKVLKHELKHYNTKGFWNNVIVDIKDFTDITKQIQLFGFTLKHPGAWSSIMPLTINKKEGLSVDIFMVIVWLVAGLMAWILVKSYLW